MFCPKCGESNPANGKFCRSCGTDLGVVSTALSSPPSARKHEHLNRYGKPLNWEGAMSRLFTGIAFLVIAIILGTTGMAGGRNWWFWMLIPAFAMIGTGIAQLMQLKKTENAGFVSAPIHTGDQINAAQNNALPAAQTEWVAPESRYKTGDLVPPSVTDATTRHLELDNEGQPVKK